MAPPVAPPKPPSRETTRGHSRGIREGGRGTQAPPPHPIPQRPSSLLGCFPYLEEWHFDIPCSDR